MVSSTYEKVDFTLKQKKNLKLFFQQDEAIYNYFNASFWKKIENYGIKRMEKDVKRLKLLYKQCSEGKLNCSISKSQIFDFSKSRISNNVKPEDLLDYMNQNKGCLFGSLHFKLYYRIM